MVWKSYFWLLFVILLSGYYLLFTGTPTIWDKLDLVFTAFAVTGLFAYAYKEVIFNQKFWSFWLILIVAWDLVYNILLTSYFGVAQQFEPRQELNIIEILIGYLFIVPEYLALYLLAFHSETLWQNNN